MPNWCHTNYAFISSDKKELKHFIKTFNSSQGIFTKTDFGKQWLGNVAIAFKLMLEDCPLDHIPYPCRGTVLEYPDTNEILKLNRTNEYYVTFSTESAWMPTLELMQAICNIYKCMRFVFISEESGNDYYVNTDANGDIFKDRYIVNIAISKDISKIKNFFSQDFITENAYKNSSSNDILGIEYYNYLSENEWEMFAKKSFKNYKPDFENFMSLFTEIQKTITDSDLFWIRKYDYTA